MGGPTQTQQSSTQQQTGPWMYQAPYLKDAFSQAKTLFDNAQNYQGNHVAQFNPQQLNTFRDMIRYGNNPQLANQMGRAGSGMLSQGRGALTDALQGYANFKPQGGVDYNIDAASKYADNPYMTGMVDAAMADARRQVSEDFLPQIARGSAMSGNTHSSRRAISEGLVMRGLADKAADVSSQMRGGAYQSGLNLAQQGSQYDTGAMLQALQGQGNLGSNTVNQGMGAMQNSLNMRQALFNMSQAGGAGLRASDQAGIDNQLKQQQYPWDLLQRYMGVVGGNNWGGTGTSTGTTTTQTDPGMWQLLGGLMGGVGSFF